MHTEFYKGYTLRGFARTVGHGSFVASGGVDKDSRRIEESEEIGCFPSIEEAMRQGLSWARDWVDANE